jgi:medium-chain acyl-[acyl-carrier-protein] hydrolase
MAPTILERTPSRWVVRPRPVPQARMRIFCLPYAGGSATIYRLWAQALYPSVEVCAVELPGHGSRLGEPLLTRMDRLVDALGAAVTPLLDRPFALFGHSMGALVAFELACRLAADGGPSPEHLFVSGYSPPQLPLPPPKKHQLPAREFLNMIQRFGGTPPELFQYPQLLEMYIPVLRADLELIETYCYRVRPPLACPVTALGGSHDDHAPSATLQGWADHTLGGFQHRELPGGHFFLRDAEPAVIDSIARALSLSP